MSELQKFVADVCEGRDASHGYEHMQAVAQSATKIAEEMNMPDRINDLVIKVAWLHDVADHKYDVCNKLPDSDSKLLIKLKQFLNDDEDSDLILKIIDRISYSKENEAKIWGSPLDWYNELGPDGCMVRDIVSDADKLEALGKIGFERCVQYTMHANPGITKQELQFKVQKHSNEKLLRLNDEFLRTKPGKERGVNLHNEFVQCLNEMPANLDRFYE